MLSESFWGKLCEALERPELDRRPALLPAPTLRRDRRDEVDAADRRGHPHPHASPNGRSGSTESDVPHAPVLGVTAALAHPHALAREMVVDGRACDDRADAAWPAVRSSFPGRRSGRSTAPPTFGQHTAAVLRDELGYSDAEIAELRRAGVIDRGPPR